MKHKKILILGATGQCGKWVTTCALKRGFRLTALIRNNSHIEIDKHYDINIIHGNVSDYKTLNEVSNNQDAIISCLGIKRKNPNNPWASLTSPSDLTENVSKGIIDSMEKNKIKRIIFMSAAGVGNSKSLVNPLIKLMINHTNVGKAYIDLENMESNFENSELDWLSVRPVTLTNSKIKGKAKIVEYYGLFSKISRLDVANWILDALERNNLFSNHYEMIGWN